MKQKLLFALCLLLAMSSCSKYNYEEVKDDPMKTRIYTLKNGLKVYLSVNDEKPRIQTYIVVRTGSRNDPSETTGLAHYLEHLMFKGTTHFGVTDTAAEAPLLADIEQRYEKYRTLTDPEERRQAYRAIDSVSQLAAKYFIPNEFDKMMASIGAQGTNANTWFDRTCYVDDIPSNQVDTWLKIEADRFKNMVIRGFHTELEAVYEEYNIGLADDGGKLFDAMFAKLFPTHPYGTQTTIGTQEHLKNPSITNIKNYFKKWYVPNNTAICMAGDFDPDEVIEQIDKYFGDWQPGDDVEQPQFDEQPALTQPTDTTVVGLEAEQLMLAWRFDKASSAEADTLEVLDYMMTNGKAGLIDLDINQQMKASSAGSSAIPLMDYSVWMMHGVPLDGQSLDDVKELLLGEVAKLKSGNFSDDLLPSVVNNLKLNYFNSQEVNRSRTDMHLDAFVNGISWQQFIGKYDRMAGMTKQQIVDFARRHLTDGYVVAYKRKGVDTTQKEIDKPAITPIPSNRDTASQFVQDIQNTKVKDIEPRFVDFQHDITFGKTDSGLPYAYVQNTENGRFQLQFRYEFGEESDLRYNYAADYLEYVGTDSLTAQQLSQQFYKLACNYSVNVGERTITVSLNGLAENMPEALSLLEHVMHRAKADDDAYRQYVGVLAKKRADSKLNQDMNSYALSYYALYGPYNPMRNIMSMQQLTDTKPADLLALLDGLSNYKHSVLYYGPLTAGEMADIISKRHQSPEELADVPQARHYEMQLTPQDEILIAPYDAKNIYMNMYHIEDRSWNPDEAAVKVLFNEYYGGGMGSVVFQELRETRGLAYSAYAGFIDRRRQDQQDYGYVNIITQNDKMMDCVRQFHNILDTIPQNEAALQTAKDAAMKKIASQRTTKFGLISAWLTAKDKGIGYDIQERVYKALPALTLQDIVEFERTHMAGKTWRYAILGNESKLDMKSLGKYGTVRRLTTEEIFGY